MLIILIIPCLSLFRQSSSVADYINLLRLAWHIRINS